MKLPKLTKLQIKLGLLVAGLVIVVGSILFTRGVVDELISRERQRIRLVADIYKMVFDYSMQSNSGDDEIFFFVAKNIPPTISFPIIITGSEDEPIEPYETWTLNVKIDTTKTPEQQKEFLKDYIKKMKDTYEPIVVRDKDGKVMFKLYYTHSKMIDRLLMFPLIATLVIGVFIIIGYLAFSNIRRNEETKVWVGMAKEAAHQLGTPLSSLLAWIEILKYGKNNPDKVDETAHEMQNDINRLNIIATRFSKIGSTPELEEEDLAENINRIIDYFEKRLPHLGKKITIEKDLNEGIRTNINSELFAWVIENLLKNAAEAIESKEGNVIISLRTNPNKKIVITVSDNGKGMSAKQRRQVFHPGYTTKKRGWGLGLSLCKRIIEQYHQGKIYVKESIPGKGTVFSIELPSTMSN